MATVNIFDMADTWNNVATTYTAIKMNVTDTASTSGSLLMDLRVGGASAFNVTKGGSVKLGINSSGTDAAGTNVVIAGSQGTGTGAGGSIIFQVAPAGGSSGTAQNALVTALTIDATHVTFNRGGGSQVRADGEGFAAMSGAIPKITASQYGLRLASDVPLSWSNSTTNPNSIIDTYLRRDAANTLALRNGTNAQAFNIYNTYTDASNYERGFVRWDTNVLKIGTEKLGTGSARALEFQTDGTTRLTISAAGDVTVAGLMNISSSGIRASSTGYGLFWSNSTTFNNRADGVLTISNYAENGFGRLQFGGTTSSFPALKRSTTSLQVRLADDSGYTNIQGKLTTETAYTAGAPTATGYIVLYDSTGTAYKIPAEAL